MTATKLFLTVATLASLTILSGCGGSDNDSNNGNTGNSAATGNGGSNETSMPDGSTTGNTSAGNAALNGAWSTGCRLNESSDESEYIIEAGIIFEDMLTIIETYYSDSDCSVAEPPDREASTYSLDFPSGSITTSLGTASFINITLEEVTLNDEPLSAAELGITNQLDGFDTLYRIFIITPEGRLHFGDDSDNNDGSTPERRQRTFDPDYYFVRQAG